MSALLDSVQHLLREAGRPMSSRELAALLMQRGLWSTQGKTPDATVSARVYMDIKKHGERSRFIKSGKGRFALNPSYPSLERGSHEVACEDTDASGWPELETISYSFTDCAEKVLLGFSGGMPMHYREITRKALEMGLLKTKGLTPEASMYAQILTEIQRKESQGKIPRFEKLGHGMVGLSVWKSTGLERHIDSYNKRQRKLLMERVMQLPPKDFERLVTLLLSCMGLNEVTRTAYSGDGGVDVRGVMTVHGVIGLKLAVQAKRWKANVQSPEIQRLRGSLGTDERGLVVTTSGFSKGARDEAARLTSHAPIDLMDGEQFISLLIEHNLGVRKNRYQLLELAESFFAEDPGDGV